MNYIIDCINYFNFYKKCFLCDQELKLNKDKIIIKLAELPHYCYSCNVDYSYGISRFEYKNYVFAFDHYDSYSNYHIWIDNKKILNGKIEDLNLKIKDDLYKFFDKVIKEQIFK